MPDMSNMPFDAKRMIFAGFEPIIDEGKKASVGYVDGSVIPASRPCSTSKGNLPGARIDSIQRGSGACPGESSLLWRSQSSADYSHQAHF